MSVLAVRAANIYFRNNGYEKFPVCRLRHSGNLVVAFPIYGKEII